MDKRTTREIAKANYLKWKGSVYEFAMEFFPHLLYKEVPSFHKEIYKNLPLHTYMAIEAFRGGAKSTIGLIIYPIWHALFKKTGDISLISLSEQFVVNEITRKIKGEFEHNERIKAVWGDLSTKKWAESYFVLKNGIAFEAAGIGGQLRGGRRGLVALDDLEDEETARSEDQRNKLRVRIHKELIPKMLPNAQMIYHGTPVYVLCYLHQIMETPDNGWFKLKFPCYKTSDEEEGNEAWGAMFPHKRLQEMKRIMGSNAFAGEMLCNPLYDEALPIKADMIRYWKELPEQYSAVIAVDPAYSEDTQADFKVASLVGVDPKNNRYLLHYIRNHAPTGEFIDAVLNLFIRYKGVITGLGLPTGAGDKEFFTSFIRRADERKIYPPIQELKNTYTTQAGDKKRNKKARITACLQPLFEQGKYYIAPEHMEAKEEILTIGQSRWDDIIDSLAYAEQILQPVYFDMKEYQEGVEEQEIRRGDTGYGI